MVAYHGILKAGAVVNPVDVMLTLEELALVLRDCNAGAVFTSAVPGPQIAELTRDSPGVRAGL